MLPAAKKALNRLRRRLLIKRLTVWYISAGTDPFNTAMMFGRVNTAYGIILPVLDKNFRIRRRDIRTTVDFDLDEPGVYLKAIISLAVWEAVYIVWSLLPVITGSTVKTKQQQKQSIPGEDESINGKAPDQ